MQLAQELRISECPDTPQEFRDRLIDRLRSSFADHTIDDLICEPLKSLKYCDMIRKDANSDLLPDCVVLKALVNFRKRKECPKNLKKKRSNQRLESKLRDNGYTDGADRFREIVCDAFADMYKSRTIDEILCYPREARALCNFARIKLGFPSLNDTLILKTIMNVRKAVGSY